MTKINILYISSIPLTNTTGGSSLMYNHLVGNHFQIYEIDSQISNKLFSSNKWLVKFENKLQNSRFHYWMQTVRHLMVKRLITKSDLKKIKSFTPELVITVAHGDLFWLAAGTAKKLDIPLISVFHDWWPSLCNPGKKYPPFYSRIVESRFRSLHQQSALSLCISEAMKKELGPNKRSEVIYPCTDLNTVSGNAPAIVTAPVFKIIYAGNIMANYGRSIQQLILTMPEDEMITLTVLGDPWDWPAEMAELGKRKGVLKKPVYGQDFINELSTASAFLVVLDFDKEVIKWTTTLFPSKIANYARLSKPILLWGPAYASGAEFLNEHEAGIVVNTTDANDMWKEIIALKNSVKLQKFYSEKAQYINEVLLNPVTIQEKFLTAVKETVNR